MVWVGQAERMQGWCWCVGAFDQPGQACQFYNTQNRQQWRRRCPAPPNHSHHKACMPRACMRRFAWSGTICASLSAPCTGGVM